MKTIFLNLTFLFIYSLSFSQAKDAAQIIMTSEAFSDNTEMKDLLHFEGIDYLKLKFTGSELKDKGYHITVKEIWDGEIRKDSTLINSRAIPIEQFQTIGDTVFSFRIISKLTDENKLKMMFKFPRFVKTQEFDAIESDDYSLRNMAQTSKTEIKYGEKFYLLAYILPYENDGFKYWCAVESSGKDIENWGKEFGIKHYLLFEMIFE